MIDAIKDGEQFLRTAGAMTSPTRADLATAGQVRCPVMTPGGQCEAVAGHSGVHRTNPAAEHDRQEEEAQREEAGETPSLAARVAEQTRRVDILCREIAEMEQRMDSFEKWLKGAKA